MKYTISNADDIRSIRIHDSIFSGFDYRPEKSTVHVTCTNKQLKKVFFIKFRNVICIHMQSCKFWGSGNSVQCLYRDNNKFIDDLVREQKAHMELYNGSRLAGDIQMFTVGMEINSGDVLTICCSEVEVNETAD